MSECLPTDVSTVNWLSIIQVFRILAEISKEWPVKGGSFALLYFSFQLIFIISQK
jgi:hypothetical protein